VATEEPEDVASPGDEALPRPDGPAVDLSHGLATVPKPAITTATIATMAADRSVLRRLDGGSGGTGLPEPAGDPPVPLIESTLSSVPS
jgi:hypothetical protein